ncbi:MAG: hypothetical protein LUQ35_10470 [Methanoregula sp.]|jgi:transposase|nr:hypothetical protein [Methanoregula sp.]
MLGILVTDVASVHVCSMENGGRIVVLAVLTGTGGVVCRTGFPEVATGAGVLAGATVWNVY